MEENEKNKRNTKIIIMYSLVAVLFVIAVVLLVLCFALQNQNDDGAVTAMKPITETAASETAATEKTEKETGSKEQTRPVNEKSTEEVVQATEGDTLPSDEFETESAKSVPDALSNALLTAGYSVNDISAKQLIVVESSGNNASVSMYENQGGEWLDTGLTCYGFVGINGVDNKSTEGDYKTPFGLFPVGDMFYIDSKPQSGLTSFQVTGDTYWVDDPNSKYYNQRVEGTDDMDWNSAEHMISYYDSYKYGFVIDYNSNPIIPGKGSAIFFHVGASPTAGCVAVSEDNVLAYLSRLDSAMNPYILII